MEMIPATRLDISASELSHVLNKHCSTDRMLRFPSSACLGTHTELASQLSCLFEGCRRISFSLFMLLAPTQLLSSLPF